MKNIWFHGGGWACTWSFGVAEILKENNFKINNVGGYSAGSLIASYILSSSANPEKSFSSIYSCPYGPSKGIFKLLGNHHHNLKYMIETILGDPTEFKIEEFNNKLWIPIRPTNTIFGKWRTSYRDYDDIVDCTISTQCIPFVSGELSTCFIENTGKKRSKTIDGGFFSYDPPKHWKKEDTIIISPWGKGDLNMTPKPSSTQVVFTNIESVNYFRRLGREQGLNFLNTYRI